MKCFGGANVEELKKNTEKKMVKPKRMYLIFMIKLETLSCKNTQKIITKDTLTGEKMYYDTQTWKIVHKYPAFPIPLSINLIDAMS